MLKEGLHTAQSLGQWFRELPIQKKASPRFSAMKVSSSFSRAYWTVSAMSWYSISIETPSQQVYDTYRTVT